MAAWAPLPPGPSRASVIVVYRGRDRPDDGFILAYFERRPGQGCGHRVARLRIVRFSLLQDRADLVFYVVRRLSRDRPALDRKAAAFGVSGQLAAPHDR